MARGVHVHLAADAAEANRIIAEIGREAGALKVVKAKSHDRRRDVFKRPLGGPGLSGHRDRSGRMDHPASPRRPQPHGHAGHPPQPGPGGRAVHQSHRPRAGPRRHRGHGQGGPQVAAPGLPGGRHGRQRGQLRHCRDRHNRPGDQRRQRPADHHPAPPPRPRSPGRPGQAAARPGIGPEDPAGAAQKRHRPGHQHICHLDHRGQPVRRLR